MVMMTIREVKKLVDSRLAETDYRRCNAMYNDKRKTCRRFKMFVVKKDFSEATPTDLSNIEIVLAGGTNFVRYYEGFYDTNYCSTDRGIYRRDSGRVMCFVWYVELD